jgi:hypothetical protein
MFILTVLGKETDGAYSVANKDGEDILYIFEEEDDASRYAMMLEESGSPEMHVIEVDDTAMIEACVMHKYSYTIITPNDIVIPPDTENDSI